MIDGGLMCGTNSCNITQLWNLNAINCLVLLLDIDATGKRKYQLATWNVEHLGSPGRGLGVAWAASVPAICLIGPPHSLDKLRPLLKTI
jgi:hypothetical protein